MGFPINWSETNYATSKMQRDCNGRMEEPWDCITVQHDQESQQFMTEPSVIALLKLSACGMECIVGSA